MSNVYLSIIMPVYNASKTLARAFASILMQKTTYDFEVIVVDDASCDDTLRICQEYKDKFKNFTIHVNDVNAGNAYSFHVGLKLSRGRFFCVLDGDDFYTVDYKFERQISFLLDDASEQYVAVGHYFFYYFDNDKVYISKKDAGGFTYDYPDFLEGKARYSHTSTMMYRNIYKTVPEFFKQDEFRGDTSRTFFALYFTRKRICILNFVGSAYYQNANGIWTGISKEKRLQRTLRFSKGFFKFFSSQLERKLYSRSIKERVLYYKNEKNEIPQYDMEELLQIVKSNVEHTANTSPNTEHIQFTEDYYKSLADSFQYVHSIKSL